MSYEEEVKKLSDEIFRKQWKLDELRLERALPVEALWIRPKSIGFCYFIALLTLFVVLAVLGFTDPRSRGLAYYVRVGTLIVICAWYLFGAGGPLFEALTDGCSAFYRSPEKRREFMNFICYIGASLIGYGSAIAYILCYVNKVT